MEQIDKSGSPDSTRLSLLLLLATALKVSPEPPSSDDLEDRIAVAATGILSKFGAQAGPAMRTAKQEVKLLLDQVDTSDKTLALAASVCMIEASRGNCSEDMQFAVEILMGRLMQHNETIIVEGVQAAIGVADVCNQLHGH